MFSEIILIIINYLFELKLLLGLMHEDIEILKIKVDSNKYNI